MKKWDCSSLTCKKDQLYTKYQISFTSPGCSLEMDEGYNTYSLYYSYYARFGAHLLLSLLQDQVKNTVMETEAATFHFNLFVKG